MISRLHGRLVEKGAGTVVIDTGGVGYGLSVSLRCLDALPPLDSVCTLYVLTHVREDAITLFGFLSASERTLFTKLTSVSGIGPKIALNALSVLDAIEIQSALMRGDVKVLCRIPGVGAKTASRMVLELSESMKGLDLGAVGAASGLSSLAELRLALQDLQFSPREIDRVSGALEAGARGGDSLEILLKKALSLLRS